MAIMSATGADGPVGMGGTPVASPNIDPSVRMKYAELAGIEKDLPSSLEGVSLAPVLADPTASVQNTAFTQHQQPFYGPRSNWKAWGYSVRTDEWRYTEWRSIANQEILARELYHHTNDPNETINVVEENPDIASKHSREIVSQFDLP